VASFGAVVGGLLALVALLRFTAATTNAAPLTEAAPLQGAATAAVNVSFLGMTPETVITIVAVIIIGVAVFALRRGLIQKAWQKIQTSRDLPVILIGIMLLTGIDLFTKYLVSVSLPLGWYGIENSFGIVYILHMGDPFRYIAISLFTLSVIILFHERIISPMSFSALLASSIGNGVNLFLYGAVVDWIVTPVNIMNLADIFLFFGVVSSLYTYTSSLSRPTPITGKPTSMQKTVEGSIRTHASQLFIVYIRGL